jgi:predicted outer membrane repeat protein
MGLCLLASCGDSTGATGGAGGVGGTSGAGGTGGIDLDVWSCTEQGIRDAITFGGGPHTFACNGPTVVTTEATIDIDNDVILDGEGNLIVDGNKSHRVFSVKRGIDAELLNLAATGGHAVFAGAGIYSEGDLLLDNCSVVENQSDDIAGGIYNLEGALEITNSTISRNEAAWGGGIFAGGDVSLTDSRVSQNTGGGIYSGKTLNVTRSIIGGNEGGWGGGIANGGDLAVWSSTISANEALLGGGIYNAGGLWIFQTTVDGNSAERGGGIYSHDARRNVEGGDLWLSRLGVIDIEYSTISNNSARQGAGIYSIALRMTAWNSTMSGNMASEEGGALYVGGTTLGASTAYLAHNTIAGNTAPLGSALLGAGATPTGRFSGNIVEGECHATDATVTWLSEGSNIESPGDTCDFTQPSDRVNITSGELNLAPLAANGGDTETHLPMTGSVAIDMIPAEQCGEVLPVFPLLDQRVVDRPQGMGCDAGSVEVVPEP